MSTAAQSQAQARALYRTLLRELPPRTLKTPPAATTVHSRLRAAFRASSANEASTEQQQRQARQLAEQLARYATAQRTYAALIERYNPGMNMDEEERVRLTARRVGMDLPVEFTDRLESKK